MRNVQFFCFFMLLILTPNLFANVPGGINYQGKLYLNGGPITGYRYFRYVLFTDRNGDGDFADAPDSLWIQVPASVRIP